MSKMVSPASFNVDTFLKSRPMPLEEYYYIDTVLKVTRIVDRLYGRQVAQRYFTNHIKFDTITITVK